MALVFEVLLVRDEVGELLEVTQHDVDRLRQLELLEVDVADRRVVNHEVIAHAVDRVAGLDLDGEIAARTSGHAQIACVALHDARRVHHPVVQAALIDVIALGVVPILLGGHEPLEEVDALEPLNLVAHGCSFLSGPSGSESVRISAPMPMPDRMPISKNSRSWTSPFGSVKR